MKNYADYMIEEYRGGKEPMTYEIIKLSESHASYRNRIEDKVWIGEIAGCVNGWQWEYVDKDGNYEYSSVSYEHGMPEDYARRWLTEDGTEWIHEVPMWKGYKPTGRVVFRGYAVAYYDSEERDWFVKDYEPRKEMSYIVAYA